MKIIILLALSSMWACQAQQPADSGYENTASHRVPKRWLNKQKKKLSKKKNNEKRPLIYLINELIDELTHREDSGYGKAQIYQLKYAWGYAYLINPCTNCSDHYRYIYNARGRYVGRMGGFRGIKSYPLKYGEKAERKLIWEEN